MTTAAGDRRCEQAEMMSLYALDALPASDASAVEAHLAACEACRSELEALRGIVGSFTDWPTDVLRPAAALWDRLADRIVADGARTETVSPRTAAAEQTRADSTRADSTRADSARPDLAHAPQRWPPADWDEVAPGIYCKLLSADTERDRVSMLVRLAPGIAYPPHRHGDIEELHLLEGELWIGDRKLVPGDYNRAEPDTVDTRVWSETGCTCVLIASARDVLL